MPVPLLANAVVDFIIKGGPIMYPIMVVAAVAVCVILERIVWWLVFGAKRNQARVDEVYAALQAGEIKKAVSLSANSGDPVVRMIHHGLIHPHTSMQGALELAAGRELQAAGRFLSGMDTIVTLGPLLGLLGTVTGIMGSFSSIGSAELAVEKVTGGIGEALIATATGLGIAIATLIPMNYFHSRLTKLQFELESAANNVLILAGQSAISNVTAKQQAVVR